MAGCVPAITRQTMFNAHRAAAHCEQCGKSLADDDTGDNPESIWNGALIGLTQYLSWETGIFALIILAGICAYEGFWMGAITLGIIGIILIWAAIADNLDEDTYICGDCLANRPD